jgi:hypothetical protein
MTMFLVLNGMGIMFLLYVLVNFWKEGRRTRVRSLYSIKPEVFVAVRPVGFETERMGNGSVICFPVPEGRRVAEEFAMGDKRLRRKY